MSFSVNLSYLGKTTVLSNIDTETTGEEIHSLVYHALKLSPEESTLKLLLKGKRVDPHGRDAVFAESPGGGKAPKILVLASARTSVDEMNAKKQDPTIRGFDRERTGPTTEVASFWGTLSRPHRDYKFGRLRECPFHDFGHRPTDRTPHAFAARQLLQRLSGDPGVIAVLQERELVVGTLGEMDPVDDRFMQKKQQQGACLLGYNTNRGLRIDLKLRTDDLTGFRPYPQLVSTLLHELSHNWVGDHDDLFFANFGQMRIEYLVAHKRLQGQLWRGKTSAELAELPPQVLQGDHILDFVHQELVAEMAQHGLHPRTIGQPLKQRYDELQTTLGQRLGGGEASIPTRNGRNLALEAAERRAREQQEEKDEPEQRASER